MASTDKDDAPKALKVDDKKDSKGGSKVADYLAAPRKKRKSYVLMALSRSVKAELATGIEALIRTNFKAVAIAAPASPAELIKNFSRQIMLLIFDDEFTSLEDGLALIAELKRRKNQALVPVLFLTRQPKQLVEAYSRLLAPYHEIDDYVDHAKAGTAQIYSKIRYGLTAKNKRRSRRYAVDLPLRFFLLADDKMHAGRLLDLSVHGALLKAEDNRIFQPGEQLKLHLPVTSFLLPNAGDYLKISARVRRVFIAGTQAGISFEYMSTDQSMMITRFLTEMVNDQNVRRNLAMKARAARQ